jgi:hypothetical protein
MALKCRKKVVQASRAIASFGETSECGKEKSMSEEVKIYTSPT